MLHQPPLAARYQLSSFPGQYHAAVFAGKGQASFGQARAQKQAADVSVDDSTRIGPAPARVSLHCCHVHEPFWNVLMPRRSVQFQQHDDEELTA